MEPCAHHSILKRRQLQMWLGAVVAAFLLSSALHAQPVHETDLKAAFIYNFILFTDWPADTTFAGGILNICLNHNSVLRRPLDRLSEKTVNGRKIAVRLLRPSDAPVTCHVLFLDASDRDYWKRIKRDVTTMPVLTISDDDDIGGDGIVILMAMRQNRYVFDIDTRAAGEARLAVSSKLLRLARTVQ